MSATAQAREITAANIKRALLRDLAGAGPAGRCGSS